MGCLQIDRRGTIMIQGRFPTRNAHTPFIARLQSGKAPFWTRRNEIVAVEHREIEKILSHLNANRVLPDVVRSGAAITVPVKSGKWIAATAFELGPENVSRHGVCHIENHKS